MGENMVNFSPDESLSLFQLSLFRTELCRLKAGTSYCSLGERCQYSHCLSWHRRNPFLFPYRPLLCPNTRFWTESKRMKVKTWCRRGRHCMFAHTKEEQMYHPLVYKTQVCRDWPGCNKPFCPFAHGLCELRDPDSFPIGSMEGPEMVEESIRDLVGEDKIRQDFDRKCREKELNDKIIKSLKENVAQRVSGQDVFIFVFRPDTSMVVGHITPDVASTDEVFDENFIKPRSSIVPKVEILWDGLIAVPLMELEGAPWSNALSVLPVEEARTPYIHEVKSRPQSVSLLSSTDSIGCHCNSNIPSAVSSYQRAPRLDDSDHHLGNDDASDDQALRSLDYLLDDQLLSFITKD
eukprot:Blabericola_migrator_1__5176@NODE_266_length_10604_cov_114_195881_g222_i0_p6_GENE_NODE_266_length_10604_cov_114_195881_g222_i0NODE_266_length_10604_cov_114_195881_g222_i0_p6_ORF_typecomplete_len350_score40_98zfCCCH/PF00642_24/0_013zfCCCH/PF00642_24/1_1zfCCCH/PF00642_24/41zfCCCH_2/PF14608_6/13zfCCCH_2/PF14608_6/4_1zfCCCH_2/PF14608_6/0_14zfCCCH_3/PF15663_5/2_1zfCCCH_3/PF15663_5/0_063_NODE_266_length_10604_cov_114_195881_g222_i087089757